MNRISKTLNFDEFESWNDVAFPRESIQDEDNELDFETLINEMYPDGIDEAMLSDLMWNDADRGYSSYEIQDIEETDYYHVINKVIKQYEDMIENDEEFAPYMAS